MVLSVTVLLRSSFLGINVTLMGTFSFSGRVGSGTHTLGRKQCEILQRGTRKEIKMTLRLSHRNHHWRPSDFFVLSNSFQLL